MSQLAAGAGLRAVTLEAQRSPGPEPTFVQAPDEASEAAAVADWFVHLGSIGVAYREMAVLFRINAQSPVVEQAFAERGIPYLVRGGERFYERPEVRQALLALRTEVRAGEGGTAAGVSGVEQVKAVLATLGLGTRAADRSRSGSGTLGIARRVAECRRGHDRRRD